MRVRYHRCRGALPPCKAFRPSNIQLLNSFIKESTIKYFIIFDQIGSELSLILHVQHDIKSDHKTQFIELKLSEYV